MATTLWLDYKWKVPNLLTGYKWKVSELLTRSISLIDHLDQCLAKDTNKYLLSDWVEQFNGWAANWMNECIEEKDVRNNYKSEDVMGGCVAAILR